MQCCGSQATYVAMLQQPGRLPRSRGSGALQARTRPSRGPVAQRGHKKKQGNKLRFATIAAVAVLASVATPAVANETRLEARGGIAWVSGASDESIGVALGYDMDLGQTTFIGVEAVADTDFNISDPVLGANARLGFKAGENAKLFATAGYAYHTGFEIDDAVVGAGYQHNLGASSLVSLQYQRYIDLDINRVTVGLGYRF